MNTSLKHVIWRSAFLVTLVVASGCTEGDVNRGASSFEPGDTHGKLEFIDEPPFQDIGKMVSEEDRKTSTIEKLKEGLKCPEGFEIVVSTRLGVARCLPKEDLPTKNDILFNRCDCEGEK